MSVGSDADALGGLTGAAGLVPHKTPPAPAAPAPGGASGKNNPWAAAGLGAGRGGRVYPDISNFWSWDDA